MSYPQISILVLQLFIFFFYHKLLNRHENLTPAVEWWLWRHIGGNLPVWPCTQKGVQQRWHKGAHTHGCAEWSGPGPDLSSSPLAAAPGLSAQCGTAGNWWTKPGREGVWRPSTKDTTLRDNMKCGTERLQRPTSWFLIFPVSQWFKLHLS